MKSLRNTMPHLEQYGDLAEEFFAYYESKRRKQTEQILDLEERLAEHLSVNERMLLDKLSDAYADVEAIAADFFLYAGIKLVEQIIIAISEEEGSANKAAKAAEIQAIIIQYTQ